MSNATWHYADITGQQQGPVATELLRAALQGGRVGTDSLVWREGLSQWVPLHSVAAELGLVGVASPPPAVAYPQPAAYTPMHGASGTDIVYAGFMRRLAALFVDELILIIPMNAISFAVLWVFFTVFVGSHSVFSGFDPHTFIFVVCGTIFLVGVIIKLFYFAFQESSTHQATFGKRAFGIKVTDDAGQRLTLGRAIMRYFASALSNVTLCIGFLMAAFTERKRALHDMVTGTLVVDYWAYTDSPERQQRKVSGSVIAFNLMFYLAILGVAIRAAISIPASYQDYTIRSQVSEGASLAEDSKTAVAEYYANMGTFPIDNDKAGIAAPSSIQGNYVSSVTINDGSIIVQYGNRATQAIAGNVLVFKPTGAVGSTSWSCNSAAGTDLLNKYRPLRCRD